MHTYKHTHTGTHRYKQAIKQAITQIKKQDNAIFNSPFFPPIILIKQATTTDRTKQQSNTNQDVEPLSLPER